MAGRPSTDHLQHRQGARLAAQLRSLREHKGLSRVQLAEAAGISPRTLERIETAATTAPGLFTVAALAGPLGVSLDDLVAGASTAGTPGIVSAGYEGRSIEDFVQALADSGVRTVADVRLNAISRKKGFSKSRLTAALAEAGIGYRHLPALGNPKDNRPPFWDGRPAEGREVFRRLLAHDPAPDALEELFTLAARQSVAVLCFEQDEERCHRKVICDIARTDHGLDVGALPM
jgi:transcriptional regulator with XRE-family HTH domain